MRKLYVKDLSDFTVEDVDMNDWPDLCDARICNAFDKSGKELTDDELDWLNDNDGLGRYEAAYAEAISGMADIADRLRTE